MPWNELASCQPEGGAGPFPAAPPPKGFFEQLVFLNATPDPVNQGSFTLTGSGGTVNEPIPGPINPGEARVVVVDRALLFGTTLKMVIDTPIGIHTLQAYTLPDPNAYHVFRIVAGLGANRTGPDARPFAGLYLRRTAEEIDEMEIAIPPATHWS